jgi:hypothetical protein
MTKRWIVARFPSPPNPLGSLPGVHVASALNAVPTVDFVPTVNAVSTDETVKARADRFGGTAGFD